MKSLLHLPFIKGELKEDFEKRENYTASPSVKMNFVYGQ